MSVPVLSEHTKLVANERAKLTATYANGLAIAIFAVGGLAPIISTAGTITDFTPGLADGVMKFSVRYSGAALATACVCFVTSGILHWAARRSLRTLQP